MEISIYCAIRYAIIDAKTATAVAPNTLSNNALSIGLHSVAGVALDAVTIKSEKKEAKIPAVTTWFAFFFP